MTAAARDDDIRPVKPARIAGGPALWLGAGCFLIHLVANPHYDVFRDELYFIVCGLHPAFGYVDQPPFIPLIAGASYKLFGTALTPLRLVPALAMSAMVALTADFAAKLGGGRFAQWLAGLSALFAPALLATGVLLTTDCLQALSWLACAWIVTRLVESRDERWWIAFGAVAGISLESKYLIAFYRRPRVRHRRNAAEAQPEAAVDLPRRSAGTGVGRNRPISSGRPSMVGRSWRSAAADAGAKRRADAVGPSACSRPFSSGRRRRRCGLPASGASPCGHRDRKLRALAIAYVVVTAIVLIAHGKAYYSTPIYPICSPPAASPGNFGPRARRCVGPRSLRRRDTRIIQRAGGAADPAAGYSDRLWAGDRLFAQGHPDREHEAREAATVYSPTSSAGARWRRRSPFPIATCRPKSAPRRCSSRQ